MPDRKKQPFIKRIMNRLWQNWHLWVNVLLLWVVLEIAVLSLEKADWIAPQPASSLVLVLAVVFTWLLVRLRWHGIITHGLAIAAGLAVVMWQGYSLLPQASLGRLGVVLKSWWYSVELIPGEESVSFGLFVVLVVWLIGYLSTWFLLKKGNAWVGVALGGVVILVNLANLPENYYVFFAVYFFAALFFVAQARVISRYQAGKGGYTRGVWVYLTLTVVIIVAAANLAAWGLPQVRIPELQTAIASRMLWKHDLEASRINFFNYVPAKQALSTSNTRRDFVFEDEWHSSDRVDYIVRSDRPSYWQVQTYGVYFRDGWENSAVTSHVIDADTDWEGNGSLQRDAINYTVVTGIKTDFLLNAGTFVSSDTPVVVREAAGDIVSVTIPRVLDSGETYGVTATITNPPPGALAAAGEAYPAYVTDNYVQLPDDFPERVRQLAEEITAGAATPYDKVLAIDDYLSRIPYEEEIVGPAKGDDPVEYFIFEQKSGFCLYFGSAMAVMLRAVDVPTRLAIGYLPGDPGTQPGEYILRDKHYHAWSQVYFPGYGWVDIEATPSGIDDRESEVLVQTPLVDSDTISVLPQWDVWQAYALYGQPQIAGSGGPGPASVTSGGSNRPSHSFAFAEELAMALTVVGIIIGILAVIATPFLLLRKTFFSWLWGVDRSSLAASVYSRMCSLAAMVKSGPRPEQTPLEFAGEMAVAFPEQAGDFKTVARIFVENRFGRRGRLGLFEEAELLKSRCRVYHALLDRMGGIKMLFRRRKSSL